MHGLRASAPRGASLRCGRGPIHRRDRRAQAPAPRKAARLQVLCSAASCVLSLVVPPGVKRDGLLKGLKSRKSKIGARTIRRLPIASLNEQDQAVPSTGAREVLLPE